MPAPIQLPFAHLNLTRNPFGELTVDELVQVAHLDVEPWLEWLESPEAIVQFVGEQGRGKTTSLRGLVGRRSNWRYHYLAEGVVAFPPRDEACVIDEIQRLPRRRRRVWFERLNLRAIGTHVDYTAELRAVGRHVLTVGVPVVWNAARLNRIVEQRIERFRRLPGEVPFLRPESAAFLVDRYGSCVRAMIGRLYDSLQGMREIGPLPFPEHDRPETVADA
ncbi:MAG: hypothetical protein R3B96_19370 [Pirellulaceae bacterium]|nr:hypothetical protein [Planctomycetales bacterium]